jgi:hypothetical protein
MFYDGFAPGNSGIAPPFGPAIGVGQCISPDCRLSQEDRGKVLIIEVRRPGLVFRHPLPEKYADGRRVLDEESPAIAEPTMPEASSEVKIRIPLQEMGSRMHHAVRVKPQEAVPGMFVQLPEQEAWLLMQVDFRPTTIRHGLKIETQMIDEERLPKALGIDPIDGVSPIGHDLQHGRSPTKPLP